MHYLKKSFFCDVSLDITIPDEQLLSIERTSFFLDFSTGNGPSINSGLYSARDQLKFDRFLLRPHLVRLTLSVRRFSTVLK